MGPIRNPTVAWVSTFQLLRVFFLFIVYSCLSLQSVSLSVSSFIHYPRYYNTATPSFVSLPYTTPMEGLHSHKHRCRQQSGVTNEYPSFVRVRLSPTHLLSSPSSSSSNGDGTKPTTKKLTPTPPPATQAATTKSQQIKQKSRRQSDPLLSLNINLDSLAKSPSQPESTLQAEELLLRIERLYEDGYYDSRPDSVSYNSVMNGYARLSEVPKNRRKNGVFVGTEQEAREEREGLESVLRILHRMEELSDYDDEQDDDGGGIPTVADDHESSLGEADGNRKNKRVRPTIVTWNTVLRSLAKRGMGEEAEAILDRLEQRCRRQDPLLNNNNKHNKHNQQTTPLPTRTNRSPSPDTITYNSCIDAYAIAGRPHDAERILRRMMAVSSDPSSYHFDLDSEPPKADTISFNTVLHAWALASRYQPGAAPRASQLLEHTKKLYAAGNQEVKPDVFSYTAVMNAWAVTVGSSRREGRDAVERITEMLHEMERCCALGDDGVCPNAVTYTVVVGALGKAGGGGGDRHRNHRPSKPKKGTAMETERILNHLEQRYEQTKDESLRPDRKLYTSVIDAYARSGEKGAGNRACHLLQRMIKFSTENVGREDVGPDAVTYTAVISALGRSRERGAADKAQRILIGLIDSCYGDDVVEDKSSDVETLVAKGVAPTTAVFNAAIDAWGKSSFVFKADRAFDLLRRMEKALDDPPVPRPSPRGGMRNRKTTRMPPFPVPDTITYNSVISAAAESFGDAQIKTKALRIATDAFRTLLRASSSSPSDTTLRPTSQTYALYAKAVRKLIAEEERRMILHAKVLEACARDGLVDKYVLGQLHMSYRDSEWRFRELLVRAGYDADDGNKDLGEDGMGDRRRWIGDVGVSMESLPKGWTRNLKGQKKRKNR